MWKLLSTSLDVVLHILHFCVIIYIQQIWLLRNWYNYSVCILRDISNKILSTLIFFLENPIKKYDYTATKQCWIRVWFQSLKKTVVFVSLKWSDSTIVKRLDSLTNPIPTHLLNMKMWSKWLSVYIRYVTSIVKQWDNAIKSRVQILYCIYSVHYFIEIPIFSDTNSDTFQQYND